MIILIASSRSTNINVNWSMTSWTPIYHHWSTSINPVFISHCPTYIALTGIIKNNFLKWRNFYSILILWSYKQEKENNTSPQKFPAGNSSKINHRVTMFGYISQRIDNKDSRRYLHIVQRSIVCCSQNVKANVQSIFFVHSFVHQ